jgi:hypothetical protein
MKSFKFFCVITSFLAVSVSSFAQHFTTPDSYVKFINTEHREIAKEIVSYTVTLAQGKSMKAEEQKRKAILLRLKTASIHIAGMPPYKNDKTLQDSLVSYSRTTYKIMNERYSKIQTAQDSASKYYESSVKFSEAKKMALSLLINDEIKLNNSVKAFCAKYNVPYSTKNEQEWQDLIAIQSASNYQNTLHNALLKVYNQEASFVKAVNKKDKEEIEKQASILTKLSKEATAVLDTLKAFKEEKNLLSATKNYFTFTQKESDKDAATLSTLISNESNKQNAPSDSSAIANTKAEFTGKDSQLLTYSTTLSSMNSERETAINNWEKENASFLKRYFNQGK